MTDAFRCNGCGEYYDLEYRFVEVEMDTDPVQFADFTWDDVTNEPFGMLPGGWKTVDNKGDFCTVCGLKALACLVEEFRDAPEAVEQMRATIDRLEGKHEGGDDA